MKKWYICEYGPHQIQSPIECKPIGIAIQKDFHDNTHDRGFIELDKFSQWLNRKHYCAFGDGYAHLLCKQADLSKLPVLYQ